jgi:hypothetical protein
MSDLDDRPLIDRVAPLLRAGEPLPLTFEARLRAGIRAAVARGEAPPAPARPSARGGRSLTRWLATRRTLTVSPLQGLAAAAGFAAVVAASTVGIVREAAQPPAAATARANAGDVQIVQFAIVAPGAASVALVGDFNGWDTAATPLQAGNVAGLWLASVPLHAGTYHYAFVVDDTTWQADPAASLSLDDQFGAPSSLVTVQRGST